MPDYLPPSNWKEIILLLLRQRRRFAVSGNSMLPGLKPGDIVLVNPDAYRHSLPAHDEIIVARHPFKKDIHIIKRIAKITADGHYILSGDNSLESTDSRSFGSVTQADIVGRVTSRFMSGQG